MECNICDNKTEDEYTVNGEIVCESCNNMFNNVDNSDTPNIDELTGVNAPEPNILEDAIEFFNDCLHEDEERYNHLIDRFDEETVNKYKLGWISGEKGILYEYLSEDCGYSDEEIMSSGLFSKSKYNDDLSRLWNGRYIYPYFDHNNNVVYAIARATGNKGGGAAGYDGHPDDYLAGKYAKLKHTSEKCPYDEPIFGINTLSENTDRVLIAEGIADAIQADIHGYSVLSPVTTQFKEKHLEEVSKILELYNIDELIFVPDSEDPSEDTIEKYGDAAVGEGLKGAIIASDKLYDHISTTTIKVANLPRFDEDKIDLDEFLKENSREDLETILNSLNYTKIPEQYDFYNKYKEQQNQTENFEYETTGEESELYDLSLLDVLPSGISTGYRGKNPIQHRGNSGNYFVVRNSGGEPIAYDHKSHQAYNSITFLLHKMGLRGANTVEGSLTPKETYEVFEYAVDEGYLSDDAKIPSKAITYISQKEFEYNTTDVPPDVYYATLAYINNTTNYTIPNKHNYKSESYWENHPEYLCRSELVYYTFHEELENKLDENITFKDVDENKTVWTLESDDSYYESLILYAIATDKLSIDELDTFSRHRLSDQDYFKLITDYREEFDSVHIDDMSLKEQRAMAKLYNYSLDDNTTIPNDKYNKVLRKFKNIT